MSEMFSFPHLVTIVHVLVLVSNVNTTIASECEIDSDCGNGTCYNGLCSCRHTDRSVLLTFDKIKRNCAILTGSNCSLQGLDLFPCVSNSHCNKNSLKCSCNSPSFSTSSRGDCRLNYGVECQWSQTSPACNPEKFLRCNTERGICTCSNDEEQVYSNETDSCLSRPGEGCERFDYGILPPCVKHGFCDIWGDDPNFGICACTNGYIEVKNSSCKPEYGSPCDISSSCAPHRHLHCHQDNISEEFRCACADNYVYDTIHAQCMEIKNGKEICKNRKFLWNGSCTSLIRINEPCNESNSDVCVKHGVCVDGICDCTVGYKPSLQGTCKLDYGGFCVPGSNECDQESLLECSEEGRCTCLGLPFDPLSHHCSLYNSSLLQSLHKYTIFLIIAVRVHNTMFVTYKL